MIPTPAGLREISLWSAFGRSIGNRRVSPSLDPSQPDRLLPYAVALNEARQWINEINALPPWFLPDAPGEQTREGLYAAYRGFIGADSWDLDGGPKIKTFSPRSGPGGDAGGGRTGRFQSAHNCLPAAGFGTGRSPRPGPGGNGVWSSCSTSRGPHVAVGPLLRADPDGRVDQVTHRDGLLAAILQGNDGLSGWQQV